MRFSFTCPCYVIEFGPLSAFVCPCNNSSLLKMSRRTCLTVVRFVKMLDRLFVVPSKPFYGEVSF